MPRLAVNGRRTQSINLIPGNPGMNCRALTSPANYCLLPRHISVRRSPFSPCLRNGCWLKGIFYAGHVHETAHAIRQTRSNCYSAVLTNFSSDTDNSVWLQELIRDRATDHNPRIIMFTVSHRMKLPIPLCKRIGAGEGPTLALCSDRLSRELRN